MIQTRYIIRDTETGLYYQGIYGGMKRYTENAWGAWSGRTQGSAEWECKYCNRAGRQTNHVVVKIERTI